MGAYDDGIYRYIGHDKKPDHITFMMRTEDPEVESCDFRLTSINDTINTVFSKLEWQDVAFFRFGYFNYQKMNLVSMVNKFGKDIWYQIDLVINWDKQTVTIYVD